MHNIHLIMDTSKQLKYTTSTIITGRFFLVQMTLLELKYLMSSKQQARNASKNVEAKNKRHNALFSLLTKSRFPTNSRFVSSPIQKSWKQDYRHTYQISTVSMLEKRNTFMMSNSCLWVHVELSKLNV